MGVTDNNIESVDSSNTTTDSNNNNETMIKLLQEENKKLEQENLQYKSIECSNDLHFSLFKQLQDKDKIIEELNNTIKFLNQSLYKHNQQSSIFKKEIEENNDRILKKVEENFNGLMDIKKQLTQNKNGTIEKDNLVRYQQQQQHQQDQLKPDLTRKEIEHLIKETTIRPINEQRRALISLEWWVKFIQGTTRDELGPIDNSSFLLNNNPKLLKPGVSENNHFKAIPEYIWEKLHLSYGGGPEILRHTIFEKTTGHYYVDFEAPVMMKFYQSSDPENIKELPTYKKEAIFSLKERVCNAFQLKPDMVEMCTIYHGKKEYKLVNYHSTESYIASTSHSLSIEIEEIPTPN